MSVFAPTATEVVYPESDGKPMADNTRQYECIVTIQGNLDEMLPDFVGANNFWYPVEGRPDINTAPDGYVAIGRPKGHRPLDGAAAAQAGRVEAVWRQCRGVRSPAGPFLFCHFTIADAMYAPMVTRFDTYGGKLDDDIRAYVDAVLATPAMKKWYAEAALEPWPEPSPDE